ncbi:DUF6884 domain-containing protein [Halorussus marinus]|uniref:DUF6884 domain-containing protein n=1 Tax=Halorussus marinus TaxID=2505976 RepID=UPI00106E2C7C|nr:DUF6884 domain-containing protein [Halorussus marinus]
MQVGLVSCTKTKRDAPAPPKDLYDPSSLFRKARAYCRQTHDEWYVLSAKHGLLDPDGPPIEPYDETLTTAPVARRREWADQVATDLDDHGLLTADTEPVVHAGKAYYEELLPHLEGTPVDVTIPTEGLMIGETLAWYNDRVEDTE